MITFARTALALAFLFGPTASLIADVPAPGRFTVFPANSTGTAVSSNGYAAGISIGVPRGILRYVPGSGFQNLGLPFGNNNVSAEGINRDGSIVGQATGSSPRGAYRYDTSGGFSMVLAGSIGADPAAYAISDSGFVTGAAGSRNAFLYSPGSGVSLLGNQTQVGYAVNEIGQVTGFGGTSGGNYAFAYSATTGVEYLSVPNATYSYGRGINDHGQIIVESLNLNLHTNGGYVFSPGQGYSLLTGSSTVPVQLRDINNNGWVVGRLNSRGTLWLPGQAPLDLTYYIQSYFGGSYVISEANAINDSGVIVGTLSDSASVLHGFVLEVPTPSGAAMIVFGIALLGRRRGK